MTDWALARADVEQAYTQLMAETGKPPSIFALIERSGYSDPIVRRALLDIEDGLPRQDARRSSAAQRVVTAHHDWMRTMGSAPTAAEVAERARVSPETAHKYCAAAGLRLVTTAESRAARVAQAHALASAEAYGAAPTVTEVQHYVRYSRPTIKSVCTALGLPLHVMTHQERGARTRAMIRARMAMRGAGGAQGEDAAADKPVSADGFGVRVAVTPPDAPALTVARRDEPGGAPNRIGVMACARCGRVIVGQINAWPWHDGDGFAPVCEAHARAERALVCWRLWE